MFGNLFDFGYTRNKREAFGFYIAYLVLTVASGALLAGIMASATGIKEADSFDYGVKIGGTVAVIVAVTLSFLIIKAKKSLSNFGYVLLGILSGIITIFVGGIGGLIPVAYLTTRENLSLSNSNSNSI